MRYLLKASARELIILFIVLWVGPTLMRFMVPLPLVVFKVVGPLFVLLPVVWAWSVGNSLHRLVAGVTKLSLLLFNMAFVISVASMYVWSLLYWPSSISPPGILFFYLMDVAGIYVIYLSSKIIVIGGEREPTVTEVIKVSSGCTGSAMRPAAQ